MLTTMATIDITQISPCPKNPRKSCDPKKLQELADSIKQKGVIEPIIVRIVKGKTGYEIVAGERRFKASKLAGLGGIPAIVRDLTDDEAYDFMLVENLQREDLTEREEAESFKAYLALHKGEDGILALAEKTGISPAYIRSRARVLALPTKILKSWSDGKLSFGHMTQLLRIAKDEAVLAKALAWTLNPGGYSHRPAETVEALRRYIDDQAPLLKAALFKTEGVCDRCASNSAVQRELFDIEVDKVRCHNPSCFKQHQLKAIAENWKTSALGKSCGTSRAIIADEHRVSWNGFYSHPPTDKCRVCPDFITRLALSGEVYDRQACAGKEECHSSLGRQRGKEKRAERDPGQPTASWHGEYFRDRFLFGRLPAAIDAAEAWRKDGAGALLERLLLFGLARRYDTTAEAIKKTFGLKEHAENEKMLAALLEAPKDKFEKAFRAGVAGLVLDGEPQEGAWGGNGFGRDCRQIVASYLGIDLAKEYAVDQEYLEKKTKAELLAFVKKFKLVLKTKTEAGKLKKSELVKLVLEHGPKLVGKVPGEILK